MQLHFYPVTAAMVPHILLEELGIAYERVLVDRAAGENRKAAHLALNPNGLLPVLTDGSLVLYETAAIALHLCDTHPRAQLAPPLGTAERAHFYKWLVWLTSTLQPTLSIYFYPDRWVDAGNPAASAELKAVAELKAGPMLDQLDAELARRGGPWFLGVGYSALDAYVFTLCRWTRNFSTPPARSRPQLGPYLQRMLQRPAVMRVIANEGLAPPLV